MTNRTMTNHASKKTTNRHVRSNTSESKPRRSSERSVRSERKTLQKQTKKGLDAQSLNALNQSNPPQLEKRHHHLSDVKSDMSGYTEDIVFDPFSEKSGSDANASDNMTTELPGIWVGHSEQTMTPHLQRKKSLMPARRVGHRLNHRIRGILKNFMRYRAMKIVQLLFAVYIIVLTFADMGPPGGLRDSETGFLVDKVPENTNMGLIVHERVKRAIVATSTSQLACLGLARVTAWFMYPTLVFVFISKFRATTTFLNKSPLAMHMYSDSHELHVYCGWTILVCGIIHTSSHIARWALQGNMNLLITHITGITGMLIIGSCLLICIPMMMFRKQIKYEVRKRLHYLFIVFAGALVFHTPRSAIPNGGFTFYVFGTLLVWYALDATYCYFFMTEKIDTTQFSVLPSAVRMTMNVSERFQKVGAKGGICYVCLPWISKNQWHAFSLFESPTNPAERQIFIQKTGDWTSKLHRHVQRNTVRPAWVHGPFPSPYESAEVYDNQILVASGIGITPALSCIRSHKNSRRINLIWAVRDAQLLEFVLRHMYLDHQGWNLIFYTGNNKLRMPNMDVLTNTNVCIIDGRPRLHEVIPNIIYGIESKRGLPENYTPNTRAVASKLLADRLIDFKSSIDLYNSGNRLAGVDEAAEDLSSFASELGFHLPSDGLSQSFDLFMSSEMQLERTPTSEELMNHLSIGFRPWDKCQAAKDYVKRLDPKLVLPTWGILYCGGAKPVLADLEKISDDYDICLHVESFEW